MLIYINFHLVGMAVFFFQETESKSSTFLLEARTKDAY